MSNEEIKQLVNMLCSLDDYSYQLGRVVLENIIEEERFEGEKFYQIWCILDRATYQSGGLSLIIIQRTGLLKEHIYSIYRRKKGGQYGT